VTDRAKLVGELFAKAQALQRMWKQLFFEAMGEANLSAGQMALLFHIRENQPISPSQIAGCMHTSKSAVAQAIDGLDKEGLVSRQSEADDRRVSYISLSPKGKRKVEALEAKRRAFFESVTGSMTDKELKVLSELHDKMLERAAASQEGGKR